VAAKIAELNPARGKAEAPPRAATRAATVANTEAQNLSTLKSETQNAGASASAAAQTAGEKIVELEALMKAVSGESAAAPAILEVSAPATILTKGSSAVSMTEPFRCLTVRRVPALRCRNGKA